MPLTLVPTHHSRRGSPAPGTARGVGLDEMAAALLDLWSAARGEAGATDRVAVLETVLLSACLGSAAEAAERVLELITDVSVSRRAAAWARWAASCLTASGSLPDGLAAWDRGAMCSVGRGLPLLAPIRPDLPIQEGYLAVSPEARLVLLTLAGEAGHRVVIADSHVLGMRTGLGTAAVVRGVDELRRRHFIYRVDAASPRAYRVSERLFPSLPYGPWGAPVATLCE